MKRIISFRFRRSILPSEAEMDYYYFELSYSYTDQDYIPTGNSDNNYSFMMARDIEGAWRITSDSNLPYWLHNYEKNFGDAVDESMGIKAADSDIKATRWK